MGISDVEQCDDRIRKAREIVERFNGGKISNQSGLMDRYVQGDLEIICRPKNIFLDSPQSCLVIRRNQPSVKIRYESVTGEIGGSAECDGSHSNAEKPPVFALDIKLMKNPETVVPSLIRLQRFKECSFSLREPIYKLFSFALPVDKKLLALGYRKVDVIRIGYVVPCTESTCDDIQTAAEGVQVSAEFNLKEKGERLSLLNYYEVMSSWKWRIFDSHIYVVGEPGFSISPECFEFGYGPIDAGFGFQKIVTHA